MMSDDNNQTNKDKVWLRIIQINDVYELKNFPHFKSLVDANRNVGPDRLLVILAGDFLAPSLLSSLDKGRGMVDVMNFVGITHVCFGNHETDIPMKELKKRISVDSKFHWINTNMRQLDTNLKVKTIPHDVIEIKHGDITKKVGLLGLLTEDPSIYSPGSFADSIIEPVIECTEGYLQEHLAQLDLDLIIPITHQRMNEDREFMNKFKSAFPIILGGHDHEVYDETIDGSRIIKTGMDGENTAILDIVWDIDSDASSQPTIEVKMIPTSSYPADDATAKLVDGHEQILHELHRAKIFRFCAWLDDNETHFTTKDNRLGLDNGTKILATMLRMGMRAECGLLNAGNIRAGKVYPPEQEWFTWSDLKAEIPYSVGITEVYLPGQVLQDTINHSRVLARKTPPGTSGGYIQTCDNIIFDEQQEKVISIQGKPFDPNRLYLTSFPTNWFEGMDDHEPLLEWAKGTPYQHAKESSSKRCKAVIVELFSALIWLEIGSFDELDTNNDGYLCKDEVRQAALKIFGDDVADLVVDNIFSVADCDGDGKITPIDMMVVKYVAEDMHNHVVTEEEIETMQKVAAETLGKHPTHDQVRVTMKILRDVLDKDNDGKVTRKEAMGAIGEVRRRSVLIGSPSK